jgi:hypothetical protein
MWIVATGAVLSSAAIHLFIFATAIEGMSGTGAGRPVDHRVERAFEYGIGEGRVLSFAAIHLLLRAISQGCRPAVNGGSVHAADRAGCE